MWVKNEVAIYFLCVVHASLVHCKKNASVNKMRGNNPCKICNCFQLAIISRFAVYTMNFLSSLTFFSSLVQGLVPVSWKTSEMVPVPKCPLPSVDNDLRPVALTALVMKCMEKIVSKLFKKERTEHSDLLQFAYIIARIVELRMRYCIYCR